MRFTRPTAFIALIVSIVFTLAGGMQAQEANPNIGKEAPVLSVGTWATAKEITQEELRKGPYVLEFWATWCGPCRTTIPHLNELAQRVEPLGVNIVGLSREAIDKVKPFVEEMGMVYHVGADHKTQGLTFRGIPFAAVIGTDGKVTWAGHPANPKFEEAVWEQAESFAGEDMKALVGAAKEGSLGELYKALGELGSERAQAGKAKLEANLALRLKLSEATSGLKKLQALQAIAELYAGVPGAEELEAQIADFRKDNPQLKKEIEQEEILKQLQAKIRDIRTEAMKLGSSASPQAANAYFQEALQPVFESFVKEHPDHPETPKLKKALEQLKTQAEKAKKAEAADTGAELQSEGEKVD